MSSVETLSLDLKCHGPLLLDVARRSIAHGVAQRKSLPIDSTAFAPALQAPRACFVTLHRCGELRGCMGCLEAVLPLMQGTAHYAYQSAFRDPRFPAMQRDEVPLLHISLSVLSSASTIAACDERDLLAQLRPGIDGVILSEGPRHATLLPQVWEHVPDPRVFVAHLKRKAGLPENYWSSTLTFQSYGAVSISEPSAATTAEALEGKLL